MDNVTIDIKENKLIDIDEKLLSTLLKDNTTGTFLVWGTDIYRKYGLAYSSDAYIKPELITGVNGNIIKPRIEKSKKEQLIRSKDKAEVFTPSWICNAQNNLIDDAWIGYSNSFNIEVKNAWTTNFDKIIFSENTSHTWQEYVLANRLEISCGEAPYLTSRYDTVAGNYIEIRDRIGLLDRKLRVVSENTTTEKDWIYWATRGLESIYGYDWQGDNVLLARENILYSVIEYYKEIHEKQLDSKIIIKFAKIIAWNIWQMDGLKYVIPNSCVNKAKTQLSLFDTIEEPMTCEGCSKNNPFKHTGIYCTIKDWKTRTIIEFVSLVKKE